MRQDLLLYKIPTHTPDWYAFRNTGLTEDAAARYGMPEFLGGIGASEMAKVLGSLRDYPPSLSEMYHVKVGSYPSTSFDNYNMLIGRAMEDFVANLWQCWDGNEKSTVDRYNEWEKSHDDRLLVRKHSREGVDGYLVNPEYPWIFASLDVKGLSGYVNPVSSLVHNGEFPLEIKTRSFFADRTNSGELPHYYRIQTHVQMLVTETDYAELAMLTHGGTFKVYQIERDEELINMIINESYDFWYNRVVLGRKNFSDMVAAKLSNDIDAYEEANGMLDSYEPEPDGGEAYKDWLDKKYGSRDIEPKSNERGTIGDLTKLRQAKLWAEVSKIADTRKNAIYQAIVNKILKKSVEIFRFGKNGYFRYYMKSNGSYTTDNRINPGAELHVRAEKLIKKIENEI